MINLDYVYDYQLKARLLNLPYGVVLHGTESSTNYRLPQYVIRDIMRKYHIAVEYTDSLINVTSIVDSNNNLLAEDILLSANHIALLESVGLRVKRD